MLSINATQNGIKRITLWFGIETERRRNRAMKHNCDTVKQIFIPEGIATISHFLIMQ